MESVGRLAGGLAHDFNNVLAVMRGQVELLQDDLEVLDSARARIDSVQRATDRAAALTDDLMAFSRQRVDEPQPFDLHELLQGVRELLHQVLGDSVTLELELEATATTIVADANRLEQAVLNLVVNARDAMPAGGRVIITTHNEPAPSRALVLRVGDTGAGMDPATRARIFEPFFTTKPPGFGTGLGLSTTDDIVRAAGGTIEVDSRRGHGTTFTLTFPVPAPAVELGPGELNLVDAELDVDDGALTVLVVDDESDVRALVAEILQGSGYRVLAAADGDAAISLLERAQPTHRPARDRRRDAGDEWHRPGGARHRPVTVDPGAVRVRLRACGFTFAARRPARGQAAPPRRAPRRGAHRARRCRLTHSPAEHVSIGCAMSPSRDTCSPRGSEGQGTNR